MPQVLGTAATSHHGFRGGPFVCDGVGEAERALWDRRSSERDPDDHRKAWRSHIGQRKTGKRMAPTARSGRADCRDGWKLRPRSRDGGAWGRAIAERPQEDPDTDMEGSTSESGTRTRFRDAILRRDDGQCR